MTYDTINDARTIAGNAEGNPSAGIGTPMDKSIGDGPTMRPKDERGGRGAFAPGDVIAGRYVVERMLGEGGMGIVYQCLDRVGGVSVAVKCLPPDVSRNADEMEDIRANYRLVADLHHQNIAGARTLELDESTGDYYLVMDLARGASIKRWMRRNPQATTEAKLAILRQVAAALDYAHARKVIHRDVKPENVMVDDEGGVKVLDFGLAAQIRSSQSRTSAAVTSRGGTPGYKSPEQWLGRPQKAPADVYAFGVMAYWLFAGYLPFDGDDPKVLGHAVLSAPVEPIAGLPAHMNAALVKALAKRPEDRFASCGAFMDALEGKDFNRAEHVERAGEGSAPRGRGSMIGKIAAVVVLLAVVAGGWWWVNHTPSPHTPPPLRGTSPNLGEELRGSFSETGEVAAGQRGMTPTTNSPSKIEGEAAGRGSMTATEGAKPKADEVVRRDEAAVAQTQAEKAALESEEAAAKAKVEQEKREREGAEAKTTTARECFKSGHKGIQLWEGGPYWAETNIGAEKPEDSGYYFWWGDTVGYKRDGNTWVASNGSRSGFSFSSGNENIPTYGKSDDALKNEGWITAEGVLASEHDAAQVQWGDGWRMPTEQELGDLSNKCDWKWTTVNGVNGYVVRGKGDYASASIFLPASGRGYWASLTDSGSHGTYWPSEPNSYRFRFTRSLGFGSGGHSTGDYYRFFGLSVRPVQGFTK